jgi:hypothetical protein
MSSMASAPRKLPLLACFGILLAITAGYQWFYCYASANGEISGLFFSGTRIPEPPELERYGFHYQGSIGYDGQMYRMIAHDPFRKKGYWNYVDDPRLRGERILIPFAAGLLGGDSITAVDFWYVAIVDILVALGGVCFVLLADGCCSRLSLIALYCIVPAVVASTDRMVLDGPSVAGFVAVLLFHRKGWRLPLWGVLVLLPFVRETNLAVAAGVALAYLTRRDIRAATEVAATAAPGLAWLAYISTWTPPSGATVHLSLPLLPHVLRLFAVVQRPLPLWQNRMMQAIDFIGIAALLFTFGLLVAALMKAWPRPGKDEQKLRDEARVNEALIILPTAIMLAFVGGPDVLRDVYGFMRIDSLLVTWAALHLLRYSRKTERFAPFALLRSPLWVAAWYLSACSIGILIFRARPVADLLGKL